MPRLKPIFLTIILSLLLFSCQEELTEETITTFGNGQVEKSLLLNSKREIKGEKIYYENGTLRIIGMLDEKGERFGMWKAYYEDKTLWSECEYESGKRQGVNRVYFPNGQLRYEGQWQNDKKVGVWDIFDEKGSMIESKQFLIK